MGVAFASHPHPMLLNCLFYLDYFANLMYVLPIYPPPARALRLIVDFRPSVPVPLSERAAARTEEKVRLVPLGPVARMLFIFKSPKL